MWALDAERRTDVKTEIPILAFLATLNELSHSEAGQAALKSGWENAKDEFRDGSKRAGLKALLKGLKTGLNPKARLAEARRVLGDHKHNVYDIFSKEDPGPALGIFHPIAFGALVPQIPVHVGHHSYALRTQLLHDPRKPLRPKPRRQVLGIEVVVVENAPARF